MEIKNFEDLFEEAYSDICSEKCEELGVASLTQTQEAEVEKMAKAQAMGILESYFDMTENYICER